MSFVTKISFGLVLTGLSALPALAEEGELTLKRVLLSTGGVGYFEYEATVSGNATLELPVRLDQVDDVMKSLVVYDSQGGVGEVSLPGRQPLTDVFRELPFPPEALSSPAALFNALTGAEVSVQGARDLTGRILSVTQDTIQLPDGGGTAMRTRISLMTAEGVSQFILEEADAVTFVDQTLQAQVSQALAALSEHGERDKRTLILTSLGEGERTLRVAYVVEAPLWKTSYRLTLPADAASATAELQGWAVLENRSGQDWDKVELTLVSGNPVTFRQALYDTYYVARPEIPVEVLGRILPPVDEQQDYIAGADKDDGAGRGYAESGESAAPPATAAPAPEPSVTSSTSGGYAYDESASITAAASTEATTQVIFTFPDPVSVASGHSLLVPFISRDVAAERLSYFQPATHAEHPLASVKLTNDGESGLPPGVLTIYERSADGQVAYVGDARLGAFPSGEERLVSYALDQKVSVRQTSNDVVDITGVKIAKGVMTLTHKERYSIGFEATGAAKEERVLLLESARWYDWTLIEPAADQVETLPDFYRARLALPAGEVKTFNFVYERVFDEAVYLSSIDDGTIAYYLESAQLPEDAKAQLKELTSLRGTLATLRQELDRLNRQVGEIVNEQARIRQNLASVPENSDLHRRYLETLGQQEDDLVRLKEEIAAKEGEVTAAQQALGSYVEQMAL